MIGGSSNLKAIYICLVCRAMRVYGNLAPDEELYCPLIYCARCNSNTQHEFGHLQTEWIGPRSIRNAI